MTLDKKPNAATQAKQRWNSKNYTQVKAHVDPDLASSFKKACVTNGVSIASILAQFMAEYSKSSVKHKPTPDYSTRRKRRAAVCCFAQQLELVRDAEEQCRDNTPENLQGSVVFEMADGYVSSLDEAIDILNSIY